MLWKDCVDGVILGVVLRIVSCTCFRYKQVFYAVGDIILCVILCVML